MDRYPHDCHEYKDTTHLFYATCHGEYVGLLALGVLYAWPRQDRCRRRPHNSVEGSGFFLKVLKYGLHTGSDHGMVALGEVCFQLQHGNLMFFTNMLLYFIRFNII